jgi:phosphoribosylamine--glycine ligase
MRVLLVGGGGREHALAWKLAREQPGLEIVAAPGNPGIAGLGRCVPVRADDVDALVALAEAERPDYTLVGPEAPLASGLVDRMRARGLPVFGPTRAAARIETSKAWAKQLMLDAGVPTARATRHTDAAAASAPRTRSARRWWSRRRGSPPARAWWSPTRSPRPTRRSTTCSSPTATARPAPRCSSRSAWRARSSRCSSSPTGTTPVALPGAQDHKRLLAGDVGPNTGGMGAYAPVTVHAPLDEVRARIVTPVLDAMRARGTPFTGLLYAGLMLTDDGPKVVEFNCRFGDPETQAVLPLLDARGVAVGELLAAVARGERLAGHAADAAATPERPAVTTVLAAAGYPETPRTGDAIDPTRRDSGRGISLPRRHGPRSAGRLVTAGGRVLAVTAVASTFARAQALARATAEQVQFAGKQFRPDIGWREAARRRVACARRGALPRGRRSAVPELPETETIARDLDAAIVGAAVVARRRPPPLRAARRGRATLAARTRGARVARVWRRAKLIVLDLDRRSDRRPAALHRRAARRVAPRRRPPRCPRASGGSCARPSTSPTAGRCTTATSAAWARSPHGPGALRRLRRHAGPRAAGSGVHRRAAAPGARASRQP